MTQAPDILGSDPRPSFFPVADPAAIGLEAPDNRKGLPLRTWVRALAGMQKEALVINGATGRAWRLVSDEGPYLAGHDQAPCPLCHFITGLVSSYMNEITALAARREMELDDIRLTLDTFYTMEGSALKGTMVGGALPPELTVEVATGAEEETVARLVEDAVTAAPCTGLLRGVHNSLFTLTLNGEELAVGRVKQLEGGAHPDPGDRFEKVEVADTEVADDLMVKIKPADQVEGVPGGVGTSLQESQSRKLHVRAVCTLREDGTKEIVENLFSPIGSEFRFLSDEAPELGGAGRAPDAATYLAAGLGFCFMTQFGRYARIAKKQLDEYRIVQDTHFSLGGAAAEDPGPGSADPVETHVYLTTPEGEDFARHILDMAEQTCFLHASCRTPLEMKTRVAAKDQASRS